MLVIDGVSKFFNSSNISCSVNFAIDYLPLRAKGFSRVTVQRPLRSLMLIHMGNNPFPPRRGSMFIENFVSPRGRHCVDLISLSLPTHQQRFRLSREILPVFPLVILSSEASAGSQFSSLYREPSGCFH